MVPDSCCKTVVPGCGRRDHASNIYKVEVGRWGPAELPGMLGGPVPEAAGGLATFSSPSTPAGRLHHQAGDLHPGAPEDHRGRGPGHCLCTGVCVGGAGHGPCAVCVGGWASPACRCGVHGGWASPVCRVCCGPGLTCSRWPCAQVFGMLFTCCLYKSLKLEHY